MQNGLIDAERCLCGCGSLRVLDRLCFSPRLCLFVPLGQNFVVFPLRCGKHSKEGMLARRSFLQVRAKPGLLAVSLVRVVSIVARLEGLKRIDFDHLALARCGRSGRRQRYAAPTR